jgi:hypothetical protein
MLRLCQGSVKALSRLCQDSVKSLLKLYEGSVKLYQGSIKALLRLQRVAVSRHAPPPLLSQYLSEVSKVDFLDLGTDVHFTCVYGRPSSSIKPVPKPST